MDSFVAIDFETASGKNPCSVGVVEFYEGKAVDTFYSLINPEIEKFNPYTIGVHGITPKDVINQPTFGELWRKLEAFVVNKTLVAHNLPFDLSVLNYSMERYGIGQFKGKSFCTLRLSRRLLELDNHKLSTIASFYGFKQDNYHNALEDALICGKIFLELQKIHTDFDYNETTTKSIPARKTKAGGKIMQGSAVDYYENRKLISAFLNNKSEILIDKRIVVTGVFNLMSRDEIKLAITNHCGKVGSSISSKTSYLVAGDKMGPSKRTKAEKLDVPIISEQEFIAMLGS